MFSPSLLFLMLAPLDSAHAHLAIKNPAPLHYADVGGADFYNAPLKDDGSDYPCKGYHLSDWGAPVVQWSAGGAGTFTIDTLGVAAHNGGSCQASISYDAGRTFKVLKSYIGDCPRGALENKLYTSEQTFDFPIPASAPRGSALFAWTWFTMTGFRQMYMNCAHVEIVGPAIGAGEEGLPAGTPDMFIGEINRCKSLEFGNLYFPDPGRAVQFGEGTRWVDVGPVGVCLVPPEVPVNALLPGRKARMRRIVRRWAGRIEGGVKGFWEGVELVKRALDIQREGWATQ